MLLTLPSNLPPSCLAPVAAAAAARRRVIVRVACLLEGDLIEVRLRIWQVWIKRSRLLVPQPAVCRRLRLFCQLASFACCYLSLLEQRHEYFGVVVI